MSDTETIDQPAEAEIVEPNAAEEAPSATAAIELHTPRGSLTLRPNQTAMDPEQKAALLAIGIDLVNDPGILPHLRAFTHMCQIRDLDPWAREAYLIGRGEGDKRKYTMQTGIDGYRKLAADTGRFIRVVERLWTGKDDDDRSYYRDDRGIMRRVWFDQWPESRGWPGAAKVIIEHWNEERTEIIETEAVADWGMYAPMVPAWEWGERRGQKIFQKNPDGTQKMDLNDMWSKGAPHMLAKCAEALAIRMAFPRRTSGIYTHEEMHRLDQEERNRASIEQSRARQNAYAAASAPPAIAGQEPVAVGEVVADVVTDMQTRSTAPSDVALAPEVTEEPAGPQGGAQPSEEQRLGWLRAELEWQAETLGHTVAKLATRQVKALGKPLGEFTSAELLGVAGDMRAAVTARLREQGDEETANAYAALPSGAVVDTNDLFGGEAAAPEVAAVDPDAPHSYDDVDGACRWCGLAENVGPH